MPQLVKGHMRFTDEDYTVKEFQDRAQAKFGSYSFHYLNELLLFEATNLDNMRECHITDLFDTSKNIQKSLTNSLLILTVLAKKEGYSLQDVMKNV
jgi:hypothetical protein